MRRLLALVGIILMLAGCSSANTGGLEATVAAQAKQLSELRATVEAPTSTLTPTPTPPPKPTPQRTATPTPTSTPAPTAIVAVIKWNTKDINALTNGNILLAVNMFKGLSVDYIKTKAETVPAATVRKAPWNYYGKILKVDGTAIIVQDYPPSSDVAKLLGGQGAEIVFVNDDSTIIDYFYMGSTGDINVYDTVAVYGCAVGLVDVQNQLGGLTTQLVVVGKVAEE